MAIYVNEQQTEDVKNQNTIWGNIIRILVAYYVTPYYSYSNKLFCFSLSIVAVQFVPAWYIQPLSTDAGSVPTVQYLRRVLSQLVIRRMAVTVVMCRCENAPDSAACFDARLHIPAFTLI